MKHNGKFGLNPLPNMKNFYSEKKILITGHTGFKGAWLTKILLNWGSQVCGYALAPNTTPNLYEVFNLSQDLSENHLADINDFERLKKVINNFQPEIIFHLAAQPLVRDSYDLPRYTYETNVMGTVNVLECLREFKIPVGVLITTDKVYRNFEDSRAFKEEDQLGGHDPYSNSKSCADLVLQSYLHSFFPPEEYQTKHQSLLAAVRAGNVIGGGDWCKDRIIPDFIRSVFETPQILKIRHPEAIRPWQHVLESLSGYLLLGKNLYQKQVRFSGTWNFGPETESMIPVQDLLDLSIKELEQGQYAIERDQEKHEAIFLRLDITKAKTELEWTPQFNIAEAVSQTMKWYQTFYQDSSQIETYSIHQINNYFSKYERQN